LLRITAIAAATLVLLAVLLLGPRMLLDWDLAGGQIGDRAKAVNDIRDSLLKAIGGLVVVVGALLTWRQLQINRQGQTTDADTRSRPCEIDVNTALTVLGRRHIRRHVRPLGLDRAGLVNARLRYARLAKADLHFADLTGATLRGADFTKADLTGTSLRRSVLVETNLYQADLRDAVLAGAMAEDADLRGTDLSRADLTTAHLGRARLDFADLRGADLTGADLTETSLRDALADDDTRWPDGFDPAAAGVVSRPDAPPIRPRNYQQAMAWPQDTRPDQTQP
jgi:pentapeptide repeat protein